MKSLRLPVLLFWVFVLIPPVSAEVDVEIREWLVPWDRSGPRDPYVDRQGRVWFCGQRGGYIAYLEPESGEFKRYGLGERAGPHNLIVDDEGLVWFAANIRGFIGRLDPQSGEITRFPMPDDTARDPHTLVFDHAGDIWFTVQHSNFVGKLSRPSGKVLLFKVPTAGGRPYGIKIDSNNRPWIVLFGSNKLMTVDPDSYQVTEYEMPRKDANPRRLDISSDGRIWYGDYRQGYVGAFDPATERFREWRLPEAARARPYGVVMDAQDRLWLAETGVRPNLLVGFDTRTEQFISSTEVPSGGGSIRHMHYRETGQEIWFGTDANTVGRARPMN